MAVSAFFTAELSASDVTDLSLSEAYALILDANHDIRSAEEGVQQGILLKKQAVTVLFPKLIALAGYGWQSFSDGTETDGSNWGISLDQTIYNGGRVWVAKRGAEYTLRAAELGLEFARQSVLMDLVFRANQLLSAEDLLQVSEKRVQRVREQLRMAEARLEVGDVPLTSVLAARVALSVAERERVEAEKQLQLARRRLADLIGSDGVRRVKVPDVTGFSPETPLDVLQQRAGENRADLKQTMEMVRVAQQEARMAGRADGVNVDLAGSYMNYSEDSLFTPETQFSVTVNWPFFQGGLVGLQEKAALSQVRQAEESYGKQVQAVRLQVEEALLNLRSLRAQEGLVRSNLENALENHRLARVQFELGAAVGLDVLDAEESLAEAENLAVNHKYETRTARAALLYVTGSLDREAFSAGSLSESP
ncbi:MAG: TolC family protein [bacterium]|nr:TolC family protein [bacterium]